VLPPSRHIADLHTLRSIGAVSEPRLGGMRPLRLGHVFGVPVFLTPSWLIVALVVTVTFADVFVRAVPGMNTAAAHLLAFAFALLLAVCVLLHELGHVLTALSLRLKVNRVVIFLFGGASEIDPEPQRPRDEMLVSAAGPLVSAVLAVFAWFSRSLVADHSALDVELVLLVWSNVSIAVFNALPGLPLDGGRVLRAVVSGLGVRRLTATRIAALTGRVIAALVAGSGVLFARGGWGIITVALSAMIGAFLWFGASQALMAARVAERVPQLSVDSVLRPAVWVPPDLPLSEALRWAGEQGARAIVVLDGDQRPVAVVADGLLAGVPEAQRPWRPVSSVAVALDPHATLPLHLAGSGLMDACQQHPAEYYLALDGHGVPAGVVTSLDVRRFLENPPGAVVQA
jgi:Zn-dependent protease